MEIKGYDSDWYYTLPAESEAVKGQDDRAISNFMTIRPDMMNFYMEITGAKMFDDKNDMI